MIGNAAWKLQAWQERGTTLIYLSSKREAEILARVRRALKVGGAPKGELLFRKDEEHYGQAAERAGPT